MIYDDKTYRLGQLTTSKEDEVIKLLCLGKSRMEISDLLEKSPNTIKNQIVSICEKLGVYSSPEIAAWYIDQRLQEDYKITLENFINK